MAPPKKTAKQLADEAAREDQDAQEDQDQKRQDEKAKAEEMEKLIAEQEARDAAAKKTTTKAQASKPEPEIVVSKRGYVTAYCKGE